MTGHGIARQAAYEARWPRPTGKDGKSYPGRNLKGKALDHFRGLVHGLHCRDGLSVRKTLAVLAQEFGVRRSPGWAAGILRDFTCPDCSGNPIGNPEQQERAA